MQQIGSIDINDYQELKAQLLQYAKSYTYALVLDSNTDQNLPNTFAAGTYDLVAGFSSLSVQEECLSNFNDLANINENNSSWYLGYLSYDLKNNIEALQSQNPDKLNWPPVFFFPPQVLFLLKNKKLRILSSNNKVSLPDILKTLQSFNLQKEAAELPTLKPTLSKTDYIQNVKKIQEHIHRGDIYEMNYCMEFNAQSVVDPYQLYPQFIKRTPSPFAAFLKTDQHFLLSASPERFLQKKGNTLISQPIKGTSPRSANPANDLKNRQYLENSLKERTENIMITDLVRNDLSRIARKQSVCVEELCGIYAYPHVYQMISTISANIAETNFQDIIRALFPMGSMTGAPKIAAMQIIEAYESMKRGLYSGSVGYIAPGMDFDFNVVIRSLQYYQKTHYLSYIAGSAITALAKAEEEYEECLLKAYAINNKNVD